MDDLRRVLGGGEDGGDRQHGVLFGQAMLGVAEQQFAKTHDDAERVVKVVGDAAGHGAKRGEALLLDDLLLRALEFRQRPLQLDGALAHAFLERRVLRLDEEMREACREQVPNAQQNLDLVEGLRQRDQEQEQEHEQDDFLDVLSGFSLPRKSTLPATRRARGSLPSHLRNEHPHRR